MEACPGLLESTERRSAFQAEKRDLQLQPFANFPLFECLFTLLLFCQAVLSQ